MLKKKAIKEKRQTFSAKTNNNCKQTCGKKVNLHQCPLRLASLRMWHSRNY